MSGEAERLLELAESWETRARTVADRRRPILAEALGACARELRAALKAAATNKGCADE